MEHSAIQALMLFLANQSPTVVAVVIFALVGSPVGVTLTVLLTWIRDGRQRAAYQANVDKILKSYGDHVLQLSGYYEKNVELVKSWQQIAEGFRDTVVLNTQTLTRVCDQIETNQYCPQVRVDKAARGPQR